jgi:beta-lactamase regulating signal transducer with metallopeptidase domain
MTVVWALTWLGQSAALAALTAAFVRLTAGRSSAGARHAAWALGYFLCAGLLAWPLGTAAAAAASIHSAPEGAPFMRAAASLPLVVVPEPVIATSGWLGWVWALGAAAGLALAGLDVGRVLRLKRRTVPLTPQEHARLDAGLSDGASGRVPCLAWCDQLDAPAVLGFARPVIALPRAQMSSLSAVQARLVLLHERAHVRRGDDWWALAERIVLALTWVNPAMHWLHHELSLSREMACDEWVLRRTAAPVAYAKCLTDVAGLRTQTRRLRLAAGATGRPGALRRRIVGVLAWDGRSAARVVAAAAWLAPVAVCVAAAGLLRLPPVVIVAPPSDASPVAAGSSVPPELPGRAAATVAPAVPATARRALPGRRATPGRRLVQEAPRPAADEAAVGGPDHARASQAVAPEQAIEAPHAPLPSSPLPGAGAAGVTAAANLPAAANVPAAFPPPAAPHRWWSGPVELGQATGGAAATAGRATASLLERLGSRVPELFTR